jgi:hypothetical protein
MPKGSRKVDEKLMRQCIETLEANGGLPSQGELWERTAQLYNTKLPHGLKAIAASFVRGKVDELKLNIKTISARAKSSNIEKSVLQAVVKELEGSKQFPNQSLLFKEVADVYNARTKQSCSFATLALYAQKHKVEIKTPKGKRGRAAGFGVTGGNRKRVSKAEKFAASPTAKKALDAVEATIPADKRQRFLPVIQALRNGSRTAAVKLNCLDCTCYVVKEIKECHINSCAMWLFRPYQGGANPDEAAEMKRNSWSRRQI